MRIVIVYELPQRELESALLLKSYLIKCGQKCEIVKFPYEDPINLRRKYRDKVDMILVHSLYDDSVINNLVYSVFGRVKYIVNLQIEQIDTNKAENDPRSYGHPKENAVFAYHVCWGNRTVERLKACGVNEELLLKVGPIQMDFLRDSFEDYFFSRDEIACEYGLDTNKKIALFISSFSYAGLTDSARKELSGKLGKQRFEDFEKLSVNSQKGIISWIESFLDKQSETIIVYRKHPAENLTDEVFSLSKRHPDTFRLISDYSVKQWIYIADTVLSWYSTAVAEAYYAKKPVLVLRPIKICDEDDVSIFNGIKEISSLDEFVDGMKQKKESYGLNDRLMNEYFEIDQYIPSYIKLGNSVLQLIEASESGFPWDKYDTHEFDRINRKKRLIARAYKPYKIVIRILDDLYKKTNIAYPKFLMKKILNQRIEKEKIRNDLQEAKRLYEKKAVIKKVVEKDMMMAGMVNECL